MSPFHYHDEEDRRTWQNPEKILAAIGLRPGMTLIDVGCGEGFFALPAARMVGAGGKVIGIDRSEGAVSRMLARAAGEGLANIQGIAAMAEETVACTGCADIVFFGIDLHDFDNPRRVLANARRMIRPGGVLADLDWRKEETPFGPPIAIRFTEEKAADMVREAGFDIVRVEPLEPWFYEVIARPDST